MKVIKKEDYIEDLVVQIPLQQAIENNTIDAIPLDKVKKAREEISKQFVDLQDGSEEWRSYVNETVLECVEILDKLIESEE